MTVPAALSTSYAALVAELDTFNKGFVVDPADGGPEKVEAAATEAGAKVPDPEPTETPEEAAAKKKLAEGGGAEVMKSFQVTLADGSVREALDGEVLLKALQADVDGLATSLTSVTAQLATAQTERDTALQLCAGLLGNVKKQGEMLKSLTADVAAIGDKGTGRKATLTVTEVVTPRVVEDPSATMDQEAFFAKALTLVGQDGFTAQDIALAESRLSRHLPVQAELLAAVARIA